MKSSFKQSLTLAVLLFVEILCPSKSWSGQTFDFKNYVPEGTLVKENEKELKVKTVRGTTIEIEMASDGSFKEASGDAAVTGDIFIPGMNLLSLKEASGALVKLGKMPSGEWNLEKGFFSDWTYEFEGKDNGRKMEYKLDAKTGQLLKEEEED